jgi:hypothetical protein
MKALLATITFAFFTMHLTHAQTEKFTYNPEKVPVGQVFIYKKSNQDGTNPHWVATYISDQDYIESLKWSESYPGATLVTAAIDWSTFSVKKFVGGNISPEGERIVGGQLDLLDPAGVYGIKFGDMKDTLRIAGLPWHSYDFDFASLNLVWSHLKDLKSNFSIHIADVVPTEDGPRFSNKGSVEIVYEGEERHKGVACLKYNIDGQGLENRGGTIWLSKTGKHFIEYLIDLPDESNYTDMKFSFDRIEKMDKATWEAFKLKISAGNK